MAVDTSLGSWFESLKKLQQEEVDPTLLLPPRPWESIPSESGQSPSVNTSSSLSTPLYQTSTLSESSLVRLAMNALQGVQSAIISIEKLCSVFSSDPADRTFHRNPHLWDRSLSTIALGRILKSIGHSGCKVFLLLRFVDYFNPINLDGNSTGNKSLVNQAFAVSVRKFLEGYISALDTLNASAGPRRSSKTADVSSCGPSELGSLTSIVHSEVTILEVYLHTEGLRTQIDAMGHICNIDDIDIFVSVSSFEDLGSNTKFSDFPIGGNLLTYLYTQLKVSDPGHCALLKFLFLRSFEPYSKFIRSWIYKAKISDPYNEFVVDYVDNLLPYTVGTTGISADFASATIREEDKVAVPCFLKEILVPLFRAGQQLQVLMKLLELSDSTGAWDHIYEEFLPFWRGLSDNFMSHACPLNFNKGGLETMVLARNKYYRQMMEKLESLSVKLDFRYQQVVPHGIPIFVNTSERSRNIPMSFAMKDDSLSKDKKDPHLAVGAVNSEASNMTDEVSYADDPLEYSDSSSFASSEEQNQSDQLVEPPDDVAIEEKYLSALSFSLSISTYNSLPTPSKNEASCNVETDRKTCEVKDSISYLLHHRSAELESSETSLLIDLELSNLSEMSKTCDPENQHNMCFPLGALQNNPFCVGGQIDDTWLHMPSSGGPKGKNPTETYAFSESFSSQSQRYDSRFLSANPVLTKYSFVDRMYMPGEKRSTEHLSSFDFTSVRDPFTASEETLPTSQHQFGMTDFPNKECHNGSAVSVNNTSNIKSSDVYPPLESTSNSRENVSLANVSGGSGWQSLLSNSCNSDNITAKDYRTSLTGTHEIPLDFVIEKCLLEEILLQYRYVSKLTIKVLEEGFNLQEHLLALRRYHFMELADWADLFIMSLCRHKWYPTEADRRISEIQGFLDLSIQGSSCERDNYKDRIYLYMKTQQKLPASASKTGGIHSFDYLGLGYRVDWPVSIILTPDALEIYADIFSSLIQIKLARSSLAEVWCSLKELKHLINQNDGGSELHELEVRHYCILMKLRHQVYHFVTTLQQYVQSQLSHVSWCKFLHSLKHKVKDLMDLESVHMSYLTDSLHICFLSDETRGIATIIQSILQCALDFRSCLIGSTSQAGLDLGESSSKFSLINISQVLTLKEIFNKNIKELYIIYLKSPKHGEFSLSRFWDYLNYNDYYSEVIGKEIGHHAFSI